jgi:ATP-dependent exoDNAse (exonuclease V) beta subunit
VRQLVKSWGEGFGAAHDALPPSIFIVGDRKQSIYGFRDADVALDEAGRVHRRLRRSQSRHAIAVSFGRRRDLAFVNGVFDAIVAGEISARRDGFRARRARSVSD